MATINLATKFQEKVDEKFVAESKSALVTNREYDFVGAHTIKVYSVGTAEMNDYGRNTDGTSRYGTVKDLDATTQEISMEKDRSFTFAIDKADEDETLGALNAGKALARQLREVVIPEVDTYAYKKMADNAGTKVTETITNETAYKAMVTANETLDENEVPYEGRIAICTPAYVSLLKQDKNAVLDSDIGQDLKLRGVIANMDGASIQKVPSKLLPTGQNFILAHPVATTLAVKLEEYKIHTEPQGVSGALVEGRIYYTAFVRTNKAKAIYSSKKQASV